MAVAGGGAGRLRRIAGAGDGRQDGRRRTGDRHAVPGDRRLFPDDGPRRPPDLRAVGDGLRGGRLRARDRRAARLALSYPIAWGPCVRSRSEEHTSELQSLMRISYAVFFLKKTTHIIQYL